MRIIDSLEKTREKKLPVEEGLHIKFRESG
jgi:hypothetical protein